ncbi:MAG: methyl-accepting chemotaxis protein [Gammaproteobacteria bacterium]|nr:methyl-accepting chemotaxis protein [Gammaproteobacteria bacterium]
MEPDANNPLGLDVDLLEKTFEALAPSGEKLVKRFYQELFKRYPDVKPMFGNTSISAQQKKLLAALKLVISNLRKPQVLEGALMELGAKHENYGAIAEHYDAVAETMLDVFEEFAGDLWTLEVHDAWSDALNLVAQTMLKGYQNAPNAGQQLSNGIVMDNLGIMKDILEHAPVNIMIADVDENVVFVNHQAREILTAAEEELATYIPGFKVSEVIGGSIHRYHKDPVIIKNVLAHLQPGDSHQGEICPGHFIFEHETRALFDRQGNRSGYVVQWTDVTARRSKEEEAFRLQLAIEGSQTAIMTVDRELVVTYANEQTIALMQRYAEELRAAYPGFNPDELVGSDIDIFHKDPRMQRQLLSNPANLPHDADINVGSLVFHIHVTAILDLNGNYIGNTLEWADVTELRKKEIEVTRLTSAVDGAASNLMLCDENLVITYANPAVISMLVSRQAALQQRFPSLDPHNLVGQNIDQFHANPGHQRSQLSNINALPTKAQIEVAGLNFEVNATAIVSPDGSYMGNMVEWKDITEQKDAEVQINQLVDSAIAGNIDQRIDTSEYSGYMRNLGNGINDLLSAVVVPLKEGISVLSDLANSDLTKTMDGEYQGQFSIFSESINTTVNNMSEIVDKIIISSLEIKGASGEISQGNIDLSQRTEEQASSLQQTASSMEELTSTVKQTAENAQQATKLSCTAHEEATKGSEVLNKTIEAMSDINAASKKIADIIGVIDEIAFQTNLLALNAAVEAARAGEQGRGFAVVAAEVRNLAQRSASAAKEIKELINDSVEKVNHGAQLVDTSGQSLGEILNAVKKVNDIIAEIAAASQEQSAGIDQINKAITQMDEVTQQNAALVEEAAAGSESLNDQAIKLNEMMTVFKLND